MPKQKAEKKCEFAYIFWNYDVFTVHKINTHFLENRLPANIFLLMEFQTITKLRLYPRFAVVVAMYFFLLHLSSLCRLNLVSDHRTVCVRFVCMYVGCCPSNFLFFSPLTWEETENNIKYSRDFIPALYTSSEYVWKRCVRVWACLNAYNFFQVKLLDLTCCCCTNI